MTLHTGEKKFLARTLLVSAAFLGMLAFPGAPRASAENYDSCQRRIATRIDARRAARGDDRARSLQQHDASETLGQRLCSGQSVGLHLRGTILGILLLAGAAALVLVVRPGAVHDRDLREALIPMEQPALQTDPRGEMRHFREEEGRDLERYGWIDRDKGVVQIPIEAAMERIAREGIPGWPTP